MRKSSVSSRPSSDLRNTSRALCTGGAAAYLPARPHGSEEAPTRDGDRALAHSTFFLPPTQRRPLAIAHPPQGLTDAYAEDAEAPDWNLSDSTARNHNLTT